MSATEDQTRDGLRNLMCELDRIIDQLTPAAFEIAGGDLSVIYSDLERVTFNLEVGE